LVIAFHLIILILIYFRFTSNALRDENDKKNLRASVLLNESFDGIPPCLFIVAELDPLRDESYGKRIENFNEEKLFLYFRISKKT
jgi:acetyl esterase/lipase